MRDSHVSSTRGANTHAHVRGNAPRHRRRAFVKREREREIGGQDDSEGALEVRNARGLSPTDWHRSELLVALYARSEDKRRFVHTRSPLSFSSFL